MKKIRENFLMYLTILTVVTGLLAMVTSSYLFIESIINHQDNLYDTLMEDYVIIEKNKDNDYMLVYDKETYIVYRCKLDKQGYGLFNDDYIIESYFAPNGLPYRYNESTQSIEMIK